MTRDLFARVLAEAGKVVHSRSSVLVPLQWVSLILLTFTLLFVIARAPLWIEIGVFALLAAAVLLFCAAFAYFMVRNPDALRSERHVLSKYAIDKDLYGDSDTGMREVPKLGSDFLLPLDPEQSMLPHLGKAKRRGTR